MKKQLIKSLDGTYLPQDFSQQEIEEFLRENASLHGPLTEKLDDRPKKYSRMWQTNDGKVVVVLASVEDHLSPNPIKVPTLFAVVTDLKLLDGCRRE